MADRMEKPTHNYHKKEDNDADDESVNVKTTTITNIYYDCLERIFDFLDLYSLLNVACTCKPLQIAAAAKFSDEYGSKNVRISLQTESRHKPLVYENEIFVQGWKSCLPFLRCFGAKIWDLYIDSCYSRDPTNTYVEQYIEQYCASLTRFSYFCYAFDFSSLLKMLNRIKNILRLELLGLSLGGLEFIPLKCSRKIKRVSNSDLNRFANEHRWVMELILYDYRFSADNAIYLIQKLKFLSTFRFQVKNPEECGRLLKHLGRKWHVDIIKAFNDEFQICVSRARRHKETDLDYVI